MPGLFRTGSERIAVALFRTPTRRRAFAGVAALAYTSLWANGRGIDEGGVALAPPRAPARALPEHSPQPADRPVGLPPIRRAFSERDRHIFGWILLFVAVAIAAVGQLGSVRPALILGVIATMVLIAVLSPELALALFLLAGGVKAAPWLPATPIDLTLLTWVVLVLAMACAALRRGGIPRIPRTAMLALGLTALVLASVWWSLDPAGGWSKAIKFELLTMSGFVAPLLIVRSRAAMTRLMVALAGSGLLIALTTVATTSAAEPLTSAGGNEITAGLYPAVGLIAALGYLALLPRTWWRVVGFVPVLILLPAAVGAGSRGVLVAGAAALAFVTVRHIACAKRPKLAAALVVLSLLIVGQLATSLAGGAASKYESSLLSTNSSQVLGGRASLYDRGVTLALDHPILGAGVGAFPTSSIIFEEQLYPHNIALELGSEEGFVAVMILAMLVSAAWWARRRAPGGLRSPEAVVTGGLIILNLGEGFFSFDINGNRTLWFALGLAFALPQLRRVGSATAGVSG
jgi:O-antigen ligase